MSKMCHELSLSSSKTSLSGSRFSVPIPASARIERSQSHSSMNNCIYIIVTVNVQYICEITFANNIVLQFRVTAEIKGNYALFLLAVIGTHLSPHHTAQITTRYTMYNRKSYKAIKRKFNCFEGNSVSYFLIERLVIVQVRCLLLQ